MKIPYKGNDYGCGAVIAMLLIVVGLLFFMNWIGWLLWGAIAVAIFSLPALSYWQFWACQFFAICFLLVLELVLAQIAKIKLYGLAEVT